MLAKPTPFRRCFALFPALAILFFPFASQAQTLVTGQVTTAEDGFGLPGVTVVLDGTSTGTVTDGDGLYSLQVPGPESVLTFSFTGFAAQDITVGNRTQIDVAMQESVAQLDEVVVIGYGERRKKDLTGSISTVGEEELEKLPFASPEFALQGNTTGVRVVNSSGRPTDAPQIFVRGIGTWNGSSQPLYVIDGQIITPPSAANQDAIGDINLWTLINPNDIASMSVLKDASAAAIYGSRGANGVILITTKKGQTGKPRIEVTSQVGIQNVPTFDVLRQPEWLAFNREQYTNSANPDISLGDDLYGRGEADLGSRFNNFTPQMDPDSSYYLGDNGTFYDWQDAILNKNALTQNYSFKISGGTEATNYYVSAGYTNQESTLLGNNLKRYNLTTNVNTDISDFLRAGVSYRLVYEESVNNDRATLRDAGSTPPWQPIYDDTNEYGYAFPTDPYFNGSATFNPVRLYGRGTDPNYIAIGELSDSRFDLIRSMGQGYVEIEPLKGFTIRGGLSLDWTYQQRKNFTNVKNNFFSTTGVDPATVGNGNSAGNYGLRTNKFYNFQADLTLNFNKTIGLHSFSALFGVQDQFYRNYLEDIGTDDTTTDDLDRIGIPNSRPNVSGFSGRSQKFWFGYVGRMSYNYASRYYLDISYRRDGSSGFPEDKRWGNFYAVSGAWRISEESFMGGLDFISDLKLRGGWGQAGNDETVVGSYAYLSGVNAKGSYGLGSGTGDPTGNYNVGVAVDDLPNTDLTWETVTTTYIGFDALLFNNTINITAELYERITNDILQFVQLPPSVGTVNPAFNIGSARNRGLDLELSYTNRLGEFRYSVGGNISFVNNEVLELYNDQPLSTGFGRVEEGRPIGHLWGYKLGGIFQSESEVQNFYDQTPDDNVGDENFVGPGDMYFQDVQGDPTEDEPFYSSQPDGQINSFDQTQIGLTIPGHTFGINLSGEWRGIDLSISFYGEGNVARVNSARQWYENTSSASINVGPAVLDRWTTSNTNTDIPRAIAGDPAGNNRFSDRWVESASFFRLNNWQLGYNFSNNLLERTNVLSRLRIFIGGQNNLLITRWSSLDPVNDVYPLPKSFFVGLNANF